MSGLAVFLEKHASLLRFDLSMRGETVEEANLRRLYSPGAGSLRHDPAPSSGSDLPRCSIGGRFSRYCNAPSVARFCVGWRHDVGII